MGLIETHPFGKFVPSNATCIVLGSFPTLNKNWRFNSFYPGRSNFFWRMLSEIYRHPFLHVKGDAAAAERLVLCAQKGIAISDTIYAVRRKAFTSKDSDLEVVEKMNVLKILTEAPGINTVILTGSSGVVSAHKVFFQHLEENGILYSIQQSKPPIKGKFMYEGHRVNTVSLYSTSGINIGRYKEALEQYRLYLPK